MKIALFDQYQVGLVADSQVRDVTAALGVSDREWPWAFVPRMIASFAELRKTLEQSAERVVPLALSQVQLRPPVPSPTKIVAAAANYQDHHQEMGGGSLQGEVFLKAPSSVVGHEATVVLPNVPGREIHYEAELAAVVGRPMRNVAAARALDYVFGYTILIDLTVRGKGDRSRRKSYEGFTPLGPWIVTPDEIPDPQALSVRLWRNGELRQDGNTRDMVFTTAEMLSYASSVMTLYPGDILTTGTPAGVGAVQGGDRVEAEVERIGRLAINLQAPPVNAPIAEPGLHAEARS